MDPRQPGGGASSFSQDEGRQRFDTPAQSDGTGAASFLPTGPVFVPRIGFIVGGGGDFTNSETTPISSSKTKASFDEKAVFLFGAEMLYAVSPSARLGLGLIYNPNAKIQGTRDAIATTTGSDLWLSGIVEGAVPTSRTVALALRGFAGPVFTFTGGDVGNGLENTECPAGATCKRQKFFVGHSIGGGGGVLAGVGPSVRFRGDIVVAYYSTTLAEFTLTGPNGSEAKGSSSIAGTRVMILPGVEF